jgi:hypothetical protein
LYHTACSQFCIPIGIKSGFTWYTIWWVRSMCKTFNGCFFDCRNHWPRGLWHSKLAQAVVFLICIYDMPVSNLGQDTNHPDWGIMWSSSVPSCKYWYHTLDF